MNFCNEAPKPRMDEIRAVTATYFGVTKAELLSPCRARRIARPRQIAMALTREMVGTSYPKIAKAYGGRDHTTALWACRRIRHLEDAFPDFAAEVARVRQAIFRLVQPDRGSRPQPLRAETYLQSISNDAPALSNIFGAARALGIANRNAPNIGSVTMKPITFELVKQERRAMA